VAAGIEQEHLSPAGSQQAPAASSTNRATSPSGARFQGRRGGVLLHIDPGHPETPPTRMGLQGAQDHVLEEVFDASCLHGSRSVQ